MKRQRVSKVQMAERMQASRDQLDRLLHADNSSVTLGTLMRVAKVIGHELRLELV